MVVTRWSRDRTPIRTNVETQKLRPLVKELIDRCGSPESAAEYAGLATSSMYRLLDAHYPTTQSRTARLIIVALYQRRKEDRRNGVSQRFIDVKRYQALVEERSLRLIGY